MKHFHFIKVAAIGICAIGLLACESCKECYLVENEGTENEQVLTLGEKCGDELESFEGTTLTAPDGGVTRSYCK